MCLCYFGNVVLTGSACWQWLAARVGVFYFSINKAANGSISHCQMGHKFAVVVRRRMPAKFHSRSSRLPPFHAPSPRHHRRKSSNNASSLARAPTISPTSQIFPPCRDGFCSSPSPAPTPLPAVPDSVAGVPPSLVPTLPVVPDSAGGVPSLVPMPSGAQDSYGVPFVTSNPALPLPEGETDSSTIRPLPTSAVEGRVCCQSLCFFHIKKSSTNPLFLKSVLESQTISKRFCIPKKSRYCIGVELKCF